MSRVRAPELPQTVPWWNCPQPLSLKALRGRVVLLDFWTYGCINCLHTIPDLTYLHETLGEALVIIGVHTPKFDHEANPASVEQAIRRYGITHPVLSDADRQVWDQYAVRAWPTFVVIDPQGYVVATRSGEGQRSPLETCIRQLLAQAEPESEAGETSVSVNPDPYPSTPVTPLAFPGKALADGATESLYIADTGHHRIVIASLDGSLIATLGTGTPGWQDGSYESAQFTSPQGLALDAQGQMLYVADTGNHRIRQVDLVQQQVSTLAGTGQQSHRVAPHGGVAQAVDLNSPWDVALLGHSLYVAMAGSHQIWQVDLTHRHAQTLLGTGAEFCVDGGLEVAAFAQPSGLATDGIRLWVADSETSSIRAIALAPSATVTTLCGSGQLFVFGNQDGTGEAVRLQHCLGLAYGEGYLWVADTYNHAIKQVDPATGTCQTVYGIDPGPYPRPRLAEPGGLAYLNGALYIADTNNHTIRRLDLQTRSMASVPIANLCAPNLCVMEDQTLT